MNRYTVVLVGVFAILPSALGACSSSTTIPTATNAIAPTTLPTPTLQAPTLPTGATTGTPPGTASAQPSSSPPPTALSPSGPVLPVQKNPITNTATAKALLIESVLVENNVDASGATASDHLELTLKNTGSTELTGLEVFYTFTDPTSGTTESYYVNLPRDFTIPAQGKRVAHFDNSGKPDHFPVNTFSLFYTGTNALDVSVTASAKDAAVQKFDLKKDAGGAEAAD